MAATEVVEDIDHKSNKRRRLEDIDAKSQAASPSDVGTSSPVRDKKRLSEAQAHLSETMSTPRLKRPAIGGTEVAPASSEKSGHPANVVTSPPEASIESQGWHPLASQKPRRQASKAEWSKYYAQLAQYVIRCLPDELLKHCGINVGEYGELHNYPPTGIENHHCQSHCPPKDGTRTIVRPADFLTTFKENWNIQRCVIAMRTEAKYEAPGSLWWLALVGEGVYFMNKRIFTSEPNRACVEAAAALWDDTAFTASDHQMHLRRFSFPGVFPTACTGIHDAELFSTVKNKDMTDGLGTPTFKDLPLVAGRPVVLAFLEALVACMGNGGDKVRLRKLFEAREFQ